jgi:hypothetical protein
VWPPIGVELGVEVGGTPIVVVDLGTDVIGQPVPPVDDLPDVLSPPDPLETFPDPQGPGGTPNQAEENPGEIVSPPADRGEATAPPPTESVEQDEVQDGLATTPPPSGSSTGHPSPVGSGGLAANFPRPSIPIPSHEEVGEVTSAIALVESEFASGSSLGLAMPNLASLMAAGPAAASVERAEIAVAAFATGQAMEALALLTSGQGFEDPATAGALVSDGGSVILATASPLGSAWPEFVTITETACAAVLQFAQEQLSQALDSIERMIDGLFDRSEGLRLIEALTALGLTAYTASRLARLRHGETRRLTFEGIPFHGRGPGPFCRGQNDIF